MESQPALIVTRKTGTEHIHANGASLGSTINQFWQWSSSDLANNALRGMLAEYLVATALGTAKGVRQEWAPYDLEIAGFRIEVKPAAYLQSWPQRGLSKIVFDIRTTRALEGTSNNYSRTSRRQADVYVFCLLAHQDKVSLDPSDVNQWRFFVLPTTVLDEQVPEQKTLSLNRLLTLGPVECSFFELEQTAIGALRLIASRSDAMVRDSAKVTGGQISITA